MSTDISLSVPTALRPWVADVSLPAADAARLPSFRVPDAATNLIFRTSDDGRSDLIVLGPQTRATYFAGKALPACVRLRLQPGRARQLLDVPPGDLLDRSASLTDFWGRAAPRLADELAEVGHRPELVLARLEMVLLDRLTGRPRANRGDLTVAAIRNLTGRTGMGTVARQIGVSERHLRSLFATEVGISPKHLARIDRLRRVLAVAGERRWAEVAREQGYYDQAHLTADFGAMMGVSPGAFVDGRLPSPSSC
jgi:AraC-like DNA-binding protein